MQWESQLMAQIDPENTARLIKALARATQPGPDWVKQRALNRAMEILIDVGLTMKEFLIDVGLTMEEFLVWDYDLSGTVPGVTMSLKAHANLDNAL